VRTITTIFLDNSLSAILEHINQTPDVDPDLPGLLEFKQTLLQGIQQLRNEERWLNGGKTYAA